VAAITAIGLVAEIGDLTRFDHPRKLMGYLGLVPSEHSSGARVSRGSIAVARELAGFVWAIGQQALQANKT
jgi:transposase